ARATLCCDVPPMNGVPVYGFVGSRTSRNFCRHLLCFLGRFAMRSRADRPEGSQRAFAPEHVALRIRPITGRRSLSPSSSTRTAFGPPYGLLTPGGTIRAYRVP